VRLRKEVEIQFYSFFNLGSKLGWVVNTTPRKFLSGKTKGYPLYRKLGRFRGNSEGVLKNTIPPRFDSGTFQSLANRLLKCKTRVKMIAV
jgi:hypothetical protein